MDREGFLDAVRQQYAEEIQEIYLECRQEQGRTVDFIQLNRRLQRLMRNAVVEGLTPEDFRDLVFSTLPDAKAGIQLSDQNKNVA